MASISLLKETRTLGKASERCCSGTATSPRSFKANASWTLRTSSALFPQIKCPLGLPQLFPPGIAFFLSLIVFLVWILTQGQSSKEQQTCYEKQHTHPENP